MSSKILDKLLSLHGGRVFKNSSDWALAEFSSTVSAVVYAAEFQKDSAKKEMKPKNLQKKCNFASV